MTPSSLTREQLYELVWSEPMLKIAARYDISSSYMARVCTLLNVPRPKRGYWAKLAVGKAPPKPLLPEARPGEETLWTKGGGYYSKLNKALPRPPIKRLNQKHKPSVSKLKKHPLIIGAKRHFEKQLYTHELGIEFLLTHGKLSIKDFEELCPEVNRRSLQRDLKAFSDKGLIKEAGTGPTDPTRHYVLS